MLDYLSESKGPELAAVSERSPALPGVLAAGTLSSTCRSLSGTSVASPQVARRLMTFIHKEKSKSMTENPGRPNMTDDRRFKKRERNFMRTDITGGPGHPRLGNGVIPFIGKS